MTSHGFRSKDNELKTINELIGLSHGIVANGIVNQAEAAYILKWLVANEKTVINNPVLSKLFVRVHEMLIDNVLDESESKELHELLLQLIGGNFELGKKINPTTLPLDIPAPEVTIKDKSFCFTGTFEYGTRKECHQVIESMGGLPSKGVTKDLDYLVIGKFITDDWIHSSYGRKIEKAALNREKGLKVALITEDYWLKHL